MHLHRPFFIAGDRHGLPICQRRTPIAVQLESDCRIANGRCLLGKLGPGEARAARPFYPQQQTFVRPPSLSEKCQDATLNSSKFIDRPTDTVSLLLALCTRGTAASQAPQYCRLGQRIAGDELRIFGSSYARLVS